MPQHMYTRMDNTMDNIHVHVHVHAADHDPVPPEPLCARCRLVASAVPVPATVYCPSCAPPTGLPLCPACDAAQHAHPRRATHGAAVTPAAAGGMSIISRIVADCELVVAMVFSFSVETSQCSCNYL
jgi:hypothetical protein